MAARSLPPAISPAIARMRTSGLSAASTLRAPLLAVSVLRATPISAASSVSVTPSNSATRRAERNGDCPSPKRNADVSSASADMARSQRNFDRYRSKYAHPSRNSSSRRQDVNKPASIVVLTGAGISAESGVATFRDKDGIWAKVDYRDVATPEGFARDAAKVHEFYNTRRRGMAAVKPNAAHLALARLERDFPGDFLLVTQNIDDLHEQAGSRKLI